MTKRELKYQVERLERENENYRDHYLGEKGTWQKSLVEKLEKFTLGPNDILIVRTNADGYSDAWNGASAQCLLARAKELGYRHDDVLLLREGMAIETIGIGEAIQIARNVLGMDLVMVPAKKGA